MSDFEKNRAEYVTHLEIQVQSLQQQLAAIQADERWIPKVGAELDAAKEQARLTLSFGGKNQTAVVTFATLDSHSTRDIASNMMALAFQDLVNDRLREVIEPEVTRIKNGAMSIKGAGKW